MKDDTSERDMPHVKTQDLPILLRELAKVMSAMRELWGDKMDIGPFAHCEADLERSASKIEHDANRIRDLEADLKAARERERELLVLSGEKARDRLKTAGDGDVVYEIDWYRAVLAKEVADNARLAGEVERLNHERDVLLAAIADDEEITVTDGALMIKECRVERKTMFDRNVLLRDENDRLQAEVEEAEEASRLFRTEVAKVAGLEYVEITDAGTLAALDRKREELVEAKRLCDKWHTVLTDSPMGHQKEIVRLLSEIESLRARLEAAEEKVKELEAFINDPRTKVLKMTHQWDRESGKWIDPDQTHEEG